MEVMTNPVYHKAYYTKKIRLTLRRLYGKSIRAQCARSLDKRLFIGIYDH